VKLIILHVREAAMLGIVFVGVHACVYSDANFPKNISMEILLKISGN